MGTMTGMRCFGLFFLLWTDGLVLEGVFYLAVLCLFVFDFHFIRT